ncbi:hypothetical protein GO285_05045 [Ralstonia solanacearum]|nr:hypothetical protein [Ralstonia solanacearum]NKF97798.1 hypothetical protein [Ralstonia solanacearum]NKG13223.1 hypothetical protein [Ralstonia solanacearum]
MLLARIQRDLFDFTERDPDDFAGLVEFWYRANSEALSAALTAHHGMNFILNVNSFRNFEVLAKRLFLVADTLILRDTRDWAADSADARFIPVPTGEYQPGFLPDTVDELRKLRPSPLTLLYRPELYWTSDSKTLNNGLHIAYAGWDYHPIPTEFLDWIGGPGREYMQTGQVVYAPFIPPLSMELEFLKRAVDLPHHFGAVSLFHQRHEWLPDGHLQALLSLDVPFLDGLDIATLSAVKQDNYDAFNSFSRSLLDSVTGIKSALGTDGFAREVRSIQRNQIDAALSDVQKAVHRINQSRALRRQGILTGLVGLNAAESPRLLRRPVGLS